ncbi:2822_t:CDS:2 [Paraglomus brasilianum]|uniref:2822_t:CDS:1 n=1 Tax=Paraglomus brasilianum TaxID=144538 RepID=A0A9N9C9M1_9GLOM|nr:2822_t:CDS:2 [Paraglomus brasilianum]
MEVDYVDQPQWAVTVPLEDFWNIVNWESIRSQQQSTNTNLEK